MTLTETLTEAVEAGADWLDTVQPGWAEAIDTDKLEMQLCSRCILGQLNSGPERYSRSPQVKDCGYDAELGFDLSEELFSGPRNADLVRQKGWAQLTELWLDQIAKRT